MLFMLKDPSVHKLVCFTFTKDFKIHFDTPFLYFPVIVNSIFSYIISNLFLYLIWYFKIWSDVAKADLNPAVELKTILKSWSSCLYLQVLRLQVCDNTLSTCDSIITITSLWPTICTSEYDIWLYSFQVKGLFRPTYQ